MTKEKPTKLCTFRLEVANFDNIDKLARTQGITRTDWLRRAVLTAILEQMILERRDAETVAEVLEVNTTSCAPDPDDAPLVGVTVNGVDLAALRAAAEADEARVRRGGR